MKVIEKLGIQEGRDWGLATLNEFRLFFNLKPYTTFGKAPLKRLVDDASGLTVVVVAQVNSDPAVAEACKIVANKLTSVREER
jgi:hypothetical protein